jgi:hypothetical protein
VELLLLSIPCNIFTSHETDTWNFLLILLDLILFPEFFKIKYKCIALEKIKCWNNNIDNSSTYSHWCLSHEFDSGPWLHVICDFLLKPKTEKHPLMYPCTHNNMVHVYILFINTYCVVFGFCLSWSCVPHSTFYELFSVSNRPSVRCGRDRMVVGFPFMAMCTRYNIMW